MERMKMAYFGWLNVFQAKPGNFFDVMSIDSDISIHKMIRVTRSPKERSP